MLFNSYGFLFCFLPVALAGYFFANRFSHTAGKGILLGLSLIFIGMQGVYHAVAAAVSALVNYALQRAFFKTEHKKLLLAGGIVFNVAVLCLFKYGRTGLFPLGISFYTFQQIAFLVERYRGEAEQAGLLDYGLFTVLFPKAVQGPIPYGSELIPALGDPSRKSFNADNFTKGLFLFSLGLFKKVMVADKFSIISNFGFGSIAELNSYEAMLTILAYTFQLYFDFSGYSDMAVGVGYMLNLELPANFNSPYKALDISDFWKRWHITLTRFLTKYIYIPLGGSRKGVLRTFLNILIVYLVSGIWHGTGVNFLIWGLLHGGASILYRVFKKPYDRMPAPLRWALTFLFVNIAWVFFRAGTVDEALLLLRRVVEGGWSFSLDADLAYDLQNQAFIDLASRFIPFAATIPLGFTAGLAGVVGLKNSNERTLAFRPGWFNLFTSYILLVVSILSMSGVSGFLYTNF